MTCTELQTIEIRRLIPAEPQEVFEAWIDPRLLARWFAPGELVATVDCFEPTAGGGFKITMRDHARGETHVVGGKFVEILAPTRIVMTWSWESEPEPASLVSVDFVTKSNGTEVVIQHDQLTEGEAALHRDGWNACLDKLEATVPTA